MIEQVNEELNATNMKLIYKSLLRGDVGNDDKVAEISLLKKEIRELEELLADANKSVDEACAAATATDLELNFASERGEAAFVELDKINQQDEPDNFVLAIGVTTTVREFVKISFVAVGITIKRT